MHELTFYPFYERLIARFPGYVTGRVSVAAFLGLAFFLALYAAIGSKIFQDWSWCLGVIISATTLCLYYATHTLRQLLHQFDMRLRSDAVEVYMPAKKILSDRNFILMGLVFGVLNGLLGYFFGVPYSTTLVSVTILSGYFLAGFLCGMAVLGIFAVCIIVSAFAQKATYFFDFTSPDGCGGTLFIGQALVIFSSITLIVGVMISVYILKTNWTGENTWWIISLKGFWIAFPYLMSLMVRVGPAVSINFELRKYKTEQEFLFKNRLAEIRKRLEEGQTDSVSRKDLRDDHEFQQGVRKELHKMRTWPFGLGTNLTYLVVLAGNSLASLNAVSSWIGKLEETRRSLGLL